MASETNPGEERFSEDVHELARSTGDGESPDPAHAGGPLSDRLPLIRQLLPKVNASEYLVDDTNSVRLREILQESSLATASSDGGTTALHIVAAHGIVWAAEELINAGAVVSATDELGQKPLHVACKEGHAELANLLIEKGADIEATQFSQPTPLIEACWNNLDNVIDRLLENGANTRVTDKDGWSPLYSASRRGNAPIVQKLLDRDKSNINAIEFLCQNGASLGVKDYKDRTPLMVAIEEEYADVMEILLIPRSKGEDIQLETRNSLGRTPLLSASINDFLDGARLLLKAGADCNVQSHSSESTPLISAASWGCADIAQALLESKAQINVNMTDEDQQTALHHAILEKHDEIVNLLLKRPDIQKDLAEKRGRTALHLAREQGNRTIVSALLAAEVDVNAEDKQGRTALHLAVSAEYEDTDGSDLAAPEPGDMRAKDRPKRETRPSRHSSVVQLLLAKNADRWAITHKNETAIHLAAACGEPHRLQIILQGAEERMLLVQDSQGISALCAIFKWHMPETAVGILENSNILGTADFYSSNLVDDVLVWAARDRGTHFIAKWLFSARSNRMKTAPPQSESWGAIQWAAHEQLPQTLSLLIFSSAGTSETNDALRLALMSTLTLIQFSDQKVVGDKLPQVLWLLLIASERTPKIVAEVRETAKSLKNLKNKPRAPPKKSNKSKDLSRTETLANVAKGKSQEKGAGGMSKTAHKVEQAQPAQKGLLLEDMEIIGDILHDPPFGRIHKDVETYGLPQHGKDLDSVLENFRATIVQFYKEQNVSGTLPRKRSVKEVIYDSGPTKIMQTANDMRKAIANLSRADGKISEVEIQPEFTWVHLPSTNITWMNDLLNRIMKDGGYKTREYHEFRSFFRDSWVEVPDRKAASRIMRPRTMVMLREDMTNKGRDGEKTTDEKTTDEKATDEKATDEKTTEEKTTEEKTTEEKTTEEETTEEKTAEEKTTEEKTAEEKTTTKLKAKKKTTKDKTTGEKTTEEPKAKKKTTKDKTTDIMAGRHREVMDDLNGEEWAKRQKSDTRSSQMNTVHKMTEQSRAKSEGRGFEDKFSSVAASDIYMPYVCFSTYHPRLEDLEALLSSQSQADTAQEAASQADKTQPDEVQPDETQSDEIQPGKIQPGEIQSGEIQQNKETTDFEKASEDYRMLFKAYQHHKNSVIHKSPTLDEWYYHFDDDKTSSLDKRERNKTQVVTKFISDAKNSQSGDQKIESFTGEGSTKPELENSPWTLLRVNQLWVWTVDNKWLITANSCVFDNSHGDLVEEILDQVSKQTEYGGSWSQPGSAVEMSRLIVEYCMGHYEKRPKAAIPMSIGQMFSNHMNQIGRGETALFVDFSSRTKSWQPQGNGESHTAKNSHDASLEAVSEHFQSQQMKSKKGDSEAETAREEIRKAIKKAEKLYSNIKDFRDELNILKSVAQHQLTVQKGLPVPGKEVQDADLLATYVLNDIRELDNVAERIQSAVNTTLSLQQSEFANFQAGVSVNQAASAAEQAASSAEQGKILMVFTFATLLFLPLSFLTSLFALDVASFLQTPSWAFAVIFLVSVAVSVLVVLGVLYWNKILVLVGYGRKTAARSTGSGSKDRERVESMGDPPQPGAGTTTGTEIGQWGLRDCFRRHAVKRNDVEANGWVRSP
ncbi:Ankyrin-1 [Colletotrichum fructicola Nara gc5]|uniref:Ankyrin-1 n=1 Tax=Colletotrichum fructicola (strain Nara gc5) TaxID=1213859 RepID=A0A7J6IH15_COLFN|nr:Ankyrin-1 [Colletotrichum fructicola Nara gc5]KAF4883038.1 Ankyrin-1 [Colletotrichum fructicola]